MVRTLALALLTGFWLWPMDSYAEDAPPSFTSRVFDGQSLSGLHVIGCEAGVENGLLVIKDGNGLVRAEHRYRDFVLELSFKPRRAEKYDSGIYFRCELPPEGKRDLRDRETTLEPRRATGSLQFLIRASTDNSTTEQHATRVSVVPFF